MTMDIDELQNRADAVNTRDELIDFIADIQTSIHAGKVPTLKSYEVLDGCESFASNLDGWCSNQKIPFDEKPTWKLVAWIILAGATND